MASKNNQFRAYFAGTKAEFAASANKTQADNQNLIVFIKDEANNGAGACIYALGTYFANISEVIAALSFVKGIKVGSDNYVAAQGGGFVEFASATPATVALNVTDGKVTVGLSSTFVSKVDTTAANLAIVMGDYLTSEDRTALEGIIATAKSEAIAEVKGNAETDTKDSKTIEGVRKYVDAKTADIASNEAFTQLSGRVDVIANDYLKGADKTELAGDIKENTDAIAILNGNSDQAGSVDKKIKDAINTFATEVSNNDTIDTFKELIDYAATHGSEFAELVGEVDANTKAIQTLNGDHTVANSVDKKIKDAKVEILGGVANTYATKTELTEGVAGAKTHAETKASAAEAAAKEAAQGYATAAKEAAIADADAKLANKANSTDVYTKTEVDSMFAWVAL